MASCAVAANALLRKKKKKTRCCIGIVHKHMKHMESIGLPENKVLKHLLVVFAVCASGCLLCSFMPAVFVMCFLGDSLSLPPGFPH